MTIESVFRALIAEIVREELAAALRSGGSLASCEHTAHTVTGVNGASTSLQEAELLGRRIMRRSRRAQRLRPASTEPVTKPRASR